MFEIFRIENDEKLTKIHESETQEEWNQFLKKVDKAIKAKVEEQEKELPGSKS